MSPHAVLLVLLSCALHAGWNCVLKRAHGGLAFLAVSKGVEVGFATLPFLLWPGATWSLLRAHGLLVAGGGLLTLLSYLFLDLAYRRGQMSLVYATSRGGSLLLLPLLAWAVHGEGTSPAGWAAMALIACGILLMQSPALGRSAFRKAWTAVPGAAIGHAWLTALAIAGYTLWGAVAVRVLPPFVYFYAYTVLVACGLAAVALARRPWRELRHTWTTRRGPAILVALGNTLSYVLFLVALRGGQVAYLNALRQLGIVFGAGLGWWLLDEPMGLPKRLGIAGIVAGCLLVSLAR